MDQKSIREYDLHPLHLYNIQHNHNHLLSKPAPSTHLPPSFYLLYLSFASDVVKVSDLQALEGQIDERASHEDLRQVCV